jgi:hypothetical protein
VSLSLVIVTKTDNDNRLATYPLVRLTALLFWLWAIRQNVDRIVDQALLTLERILTGIQLLFARFLTGIQFTITLLSIGFTSLAWGMGVRL